MKNMNLVTIAEQDITTVGASLYVLIPKILREQWQVTAGDRVIFLRQSDESDIIIRIEKKKSS